MLMSQLWFLTIAVLLALLYYVVWTADAIPCISSFALCLNMLTCGLVFP